MKRKPKPPPFDFEADAALIALFAEAKRRAVDRGECCPAITNRYMANRYIDQCSDFMSCASQYLDAEERAAANLFLFGLVERGMRRQFKHVGMYAAQLVEHRPLYLPDFETLLEPRFIEMMAVGLTDSDVHNNGLLRLSIAALPYAVDVVRRHLKARKLNADKLFIENISTNYRNIGR